MNRYRNDDSFLEYTQLQASKTQCYHESITGTELSAEIKLENFVLKILCKD